MILVICIFFFSTCLESSVPSFGGENIFKSQKKIKLNPGAPTCSMVVGFILQRTVNFLGHRGFM